MAFLMTKPAAVAAPLPHRMRVIMAAYPRAASWNLSRLCVFADMINAKPVGNDVFRDAYGFEYKIQ